MKKRIMLCLCIACALLSSCGSEKTTSKEPQQTQTPKSASQLTTGQKNALEYAKFCLDTAPFSKIILIGVLELEGYSTEDATYAAENCGADWNVQAEKEAESYIKEKPSVSREKLLDHLDFAGFTHEQALHGAQTVGY